MTENPSNERKDPAEQYKVDEAVETQEQAPEAEPEVVEEDEPAPAEPVEVTAPAPTSVKTHSSHGETYTVDPDRGLRLQR